MIDLRPVGYIIGLLVGALGLTMLVPFGVDLAYGNSDAGNFALSAMITVVAGALMALATANASLKVLTIQQTFLLTTLSWLVLPIFGALPFWLGEPSASYTDAFFEAMSGLTTTGSTVFTQLHTLPEGTLLWRGLMQWFGGVGIIVVAMAFLPTLKVGGMQIFRSEGFDTIGKVLPRAAEIATSISVVYLVLTATCIASYAAVGMGLFDAIVHALTTVATGGFSNYDDSFVGFSEATEYVSTIFMILASLPFIRYVQILNGSAKPLFKDSQVWAFFGFWAILVISMASYRYFNAAGEFEGTFRQSLFNVTSILTGTGYASADYGLWGAFPVMMFFLMGLVGGCAGSTCCSIKIFRWQLLVAAIRSQIQKIHSPSGVFVPRYQGRRVGEDVMSSVTAFFIAFMLSLATLAIILGLLGLDAVTAISGAATALANVGPGLGELIGPSGNFESLPDSAKWVLSAAMLIGRLELMAVYVLFSVAFWRH
ncbi:MAG: TrkH family potassium uptake protein [Rhodobacteraceae bacterium]|nr:TrkH family potassium uptake protein [Paracoccaceae bacterium]